MRCSVSVFDSVGYAILGDNLRVPKVMVWGRLIMSSPSPRFWSVTVERDNNAHLIAFAPGEASGTTALCGQSLSEDGIEVLQDTVAVPVGDECAKCLIIAGFLETKEPKPLTPLQRMMQDFAEIAAALNECGYTKEEKKVLLQKVLDFSIHPE
jgi:hypothetical protein